MSKFFSVDIGGTKIKYGVITNKGEIIEKGIMDTKGELGIENILERLDIFIKSYGYKFSGITLSCSGQVNSKEGKIIGGTPIIKDYIDYPIKKRMESKYNIPCEIENDVNCAALGELWLGAGKNFEDFVCLTIGTGIGGGIVINKKIYSGVSGIAGEFGHFQLIKNGRKCSCGKNGCYEQYASTKALVEVVAHTTGKILSGKEIFEEVFKNNEPIVKIMEEWLDYITDGLSVLIQIFNPPLIIIGGGISEQKEYLINKLLNMLQKKVHPNYLSSFNLEVAACGNDAGMIGAVYNLLLKHDFI